MPWIRLRPMLLLAAAGLLAGCASFRADRGDDATTLAVAVTELEMQLQSDPYRTFGDLRADGRNVFDVSLWRLDRLRRQIASSASPHRADALAVVEYARGRALERLGRYHDALDAYDQVARAGGLLSRDARKSAEMADFFAGNVATSAQPGARSVVHWSTEWRSIAAAFADSEYAALALQEAERLEIAQVEQLARKGDLAPAIEACRSLIENNRESKLYGRHLIRLGDLYAELVRRERERARHQRRAIDAARYERSLDRALSAYELATESRKPHLRHEAQTKIDALIAYHEGVRTDVR